MDVNALWNSLQNTLGGQIPYLLGALVIFVIGWVIAVSLRAGVRLGLSRLGINQHFQSLTGYRLDIEGIIAILLFWTVILLVLIGIFNSLGLTVISAPFSALANEIFQYAPRLLSATLLALVAWLLASIVRTLVIKGLDRTQLDESLAEHARMPPIAESLAQALFWLVILLFLPAILGTLQMEGLLDPLRDMVARVLDMLPNAVGALVIGGVGWIVATVLKNIVINLTHTAGIDGLGNFAGLNENTRLSRILGVLVFLVVFIPSLISALDALKIEAISRPATDMLSMIMLSIPDIIAAALILTVTWLVASFASKLLAGLLATMGFDQLPERINLAPAFARTSASMFAGRLVFFFAMLFACVEAASQLGFDQVSDIVTTFIRFAGDILLGGVIFVVGYWLANVACEAIDQASGEHSKGLARIARYAILALVTAMGLRAMGIADDIVNLAFGLTLGSIAVAVALSFGLGGREAAGKLMEHWLAKLRRGE
ncbi:MAG: mechanosensitive ion channel [Sterolibacterium sp.]|nr:mechanosensitive ion channel [Sterolibacterium sp.]